MEQKRDEETSRAKGQRGSQRFWYAPEGDTPCGSDYVCQGNEDDSGQSNAHQQKTDQQQVSPHALRSNDYAGEQSRDSDERSDIGYPHHRSRNQCGLAGAIHCAPPALACTGTELAPAAGAATAVGGFCACTDLT